MRARHARSSTGRRCCGRRPSRSTALPARARRGQLRQRLHPPACRDDGPPLGSSWAASPTSASPLPGAVGRHPASRCPRCGADPRPRQRAGPQLAAAPRPLPLVPRPDLARATRRSRRRTASSGWRSRALRGPRPQTVRRDGARHRPPRPEPDRPRPPAPAGRDHAARASRRGLAASFLPGSPVRPLDAAPRGARAAGSPSPPWRRPTSGCGASRASGRATGRWRRCSGAFLGWQQLLLTVLLASVAGTARRPRRDRAAAAATCSHALPLGTFLGAAGSWSSSSATRSSPGTAGSSVADLRPDVDAPRRGAGPGRGRPLRGALAPAGRALACGGCGPASPSEAEQRVDAAAAAARRRARARRPGGVGRWRPRPRSRARLASEVEVLDAGGASSSRGRPSLPSPTPCGPEQRQRLAAGRPVTVVAQEGPVVRALVYLPLPGASRRARPAPRRAGPGPRGGAARAAAGLPRAPGLARRPRRSPPPSSSCPASRQPPAPPEGALDAYEQAMERLRDRGEEMTARHEAERRRHGGGDPREGGAGPRRRADRGHRPRGAQRPRHDRRLRAAARAGRRCAEDPADRRARDPRGVRDARDGGAAVHRLRQAREAAARRHVDLARLLAARRRPASRGPARRCDARLVGLDAPLVVRADEELLERAFENLVRNAVEAAAAGGRHVEVAARDGAAASRSAIDDDGPGLAPDHPGEIRPFYTTRPGRPRASACRSRARSCSCTAARWTSRRRAPRGARVDVAPARRRARTLTAHVTNCSVRPSDGTARARAVGERSQAYCRNRA